MRDTRKLRSTGGNARCRQSSRSQIRQLTPIRAGGPNKPYEIAGRRIVPFTADLPLVETGLASWYGRKYHEIGRASCRERV